MSSRRIPRPEISLAESRAEHYIKEQFSNLVGKLNTRFRIEMKNSSAQSTSDESHILYYPAFLSYFIEVSPKVFVATPDWALAFLQENLASTTRQLCNIIHCRDKELGRRLIQKIAVWMMEKYSRKLDPWSWSCSEQFQESLPNPNQTQIAIINKEIDAFEHICDPVRGDNYPLFQEVFDAICITADLPAADELEATLDQLPGGDSYDNVFRGFAKFLKETTGNEINPAHVVAALTKCTIPFNTDIFFDAVQVSNNRVTDAFAVTMKGFRAVAYKFCKQIIRRDFIQASKKFENVHSLCPVKRLAIYRAVKFLMSVRNGWITAKTCDFNSEIEDHNVYPTPEEREEIDNGIRDIAAEVFNAARQVFGDEAVDNFAPVRCSELDLQSIMGFAPGPELSTMITSVESDALVSAWLDKGLSSGPDTTVFPEPVNNYNPTSTITSQASFTSHNFTSATAVNFNPVVNLGPALIGLNNTNAATIETISIPPVPQITVGNHTYPLHVWNAAEREFDSLGTIKAGKYLFHEMFTHEEKLTCTWGGKNGTPKYPTEIVNAIYDALEKFEVDAGKEPTSTVVIKTQVFVDTGNQFRNPRPKKNKDTK